MVDTRSEGQEAAVSRYQHNNVPVVSIVGIVSARVNVRATWTSLIHRSQGEL